MYSKKFLFLFDNYVSKTGSRVSVQLNIGFIKYHNSRTNIDMPACFLTKMAAIGKNDGSGIEEKQNVDINVGIVFA